MSCPPVTCGSVLITQYQLLDLSTDDKPIGASPRRDYVVKRMVLVQIEYNLVLTLSWCRDISKKGGNAPRATD